MDAPLAPKLCAGVLGRALLQGVLPPDSILEFCKPIEGGEVRRALIGPALQYVKVRSCGTFTEALVAVTQPHFERVAWASARELCSRWHVLSGAAPLHGTLPLSSPIG